MFRNPNAELRCDIRVDSEESTSYVLPIWHRLGASAMFYQCIETAVCGTLTLPPKGALPTRSFHQDLQRHIARIKDPTVRTGLLYT